MALKSMTPGLKRKSGSVLSVGKSCLRTRERLRSSLRRTKMPKCPKCNEEVDYLISKETHFTSFTAYDHKPRYDETLLDPFYYTHENKEEKWYCPNCGDLLFTTEYNAIEFFNQEEKEEQHAENVQDNQG